MTELEKIAREIADFIVPGVPEKPGSTFDAVVWDIAYSTALASITPPAAEGVDGLLPCPFCGQTPIIDPCQEAFQATVTISCPGLWPAVDVRECPVWPQVAAETLEEATAAWNTRAPAATLSASKDLDR